MATSEKLFNGSVRKRTKAPKGEYTPPSMEPKRYRSLKEIMKIAPRCELSDCFDELDCEKCGSGERSDEMLLCDKCNKGFHMFCLRPIVVRIPIGSWVCPSCSDDKMEKSLPLLQTRIIDFFGIEKVADLTETSKAMQEGRRRRRRSLVMCKRRKRLLPFIPTKDNERRLEQMGSLANALRSLDMEFSNELTYNPSMAPRSANQASFEYGGMQELPKDDIATLEQCKAMYKRGECPPLRVVFDALEGYTVEADGSIKDLTLITEYTGDVDYIKNRENDDCNSMMTLLLATNPLESLVICPDKRGNIARFINGINNHSREGRKKQNLKCVRYNVNGECRVLLVAIRDIAKGERLYYDYNGYENAYPTHHFV